MQLTSSWQVGAMVMDSVDLLAPLEPPPPEYTSRHI